MNGLIIFLATLFQRSLNRLFSPHSISFDTYYHLFYANLIRKNHYRIPQSHDRLIIKTDYQYPFFYHYILALLPKQLEKAAERFLNPLLDALFNTFLYILTYQLTRSFEQAILVSLFYLCTPFFFTVQTIGPRISNATPRLLGEILTGMVFVCEYLFILHQDSSMIMLAIGLAALVFITSKFSVQAFFFISVLMSIFTLNPVFFIVFTAGLVLSIVLSRGRYLKIIRNQIGHLTWYFINNLKGRMHVSHRNSLKNLFNRSKFRQQFFYDNSYLIVLCKFPIFFYVLWFCITQPMPELLYIPGLFILSASIIYLLTSIKLFLFLGEAERYLLHVIFFVLLVMSFSIQNSVIIALILLYGILFQVVDIFYLLRRKKRAATQTYQEDVITWLKDQKQTLNILTVPFSLGGWRVIYETQHNWLYMERFDKESNLKWNEIMLKYPYINLDKIDEVVKEFNIDTIIIQKEKALEHFKNIPTPQDFSSFDLNEHIVIQRKISPATVQLIGGEKAAQLL